MAMSSTGSSGAVKAEPNVTPLIDVMLVLLIIFMIVTPLINSGFQAQPPDGINIKAHPEENDDVVLGIDAKLLAHQRVERGFAVAEQPLGGSLLFFHGGVPVLAEPPAVPRGEVRLRGWAGRRPTCSPASTTGRVRSG